MPCVMELFLPIGETYCGSEPANMSFIDLAVIPLLFMLTIWGVLFWKLKFGAKIMDVFRETTSFEHALVALKEGKSIRRRYSNYGLARMMVSLRGMDTVRFCEFDIRSKDKLSESPSLKVDDILATDWVIED